MELTTYVLEAHNKDNTGYIGIPVERINRSGSLKGPRKNNPYFFIAGAKPIRHCRIHKGGFLDYTVRGIPTFSTLNDWAESCGTSTSNIYFGFECFDPTYSNVHLETMFNLNVDTDPFTKLRAKMDELNLGFSKLAVVGVYTITMAEDFIK
jgi:hypothetical protein